MAGYGQLFFTLRANDRYVFSLQGWMYPFVGASSPFCFSFSQTTARKRGSFVEQSFGLSVFLSFSSHSSSSLGRFAHLSPRFHYFRPLFPAIVFFRRVRNASLSSFGFNRPLQLRQFLVRPSRARGRDSKKRAPTKRSDDLEVRQSYFPAVEHAPSYLISATQRPNFFPLRAKKLEQLSVV